MRTWEWSHTRKRGTRVRTIGHATRSAPRTYALNAARPRRSPIPGRVAAAIDTGDLVSSLPDNTAGCCSPRLPFVPRPITIPLRSRGRVQSSRSNGIQDGPAIEFEDSIFSHFLASYYTLTFLTLDDSFFKKKEIFERAL